MDNIRNTFCSFKGYENQNYNCEINTTTALFNNNNNDNNDTEAYNNISFDLDPIVVKEFFVYVKI